MDLATSASQKAIVSPISYDDSLRSHVVAAATSILARLGLVDSALSSMKSPLASMVHDSLEIIETTLHELISVFPEPTESCQDPTPAVVSSAYSDAQKTVNAAPAIGVVASKVIMTTPDVLLTEYDKLLAMQASNDPETLKRCIALVRMQLLETEMKLDEQKSEMNALIASHARRCDGYEYAKHEMEREILNLRRSLTKEQFEPHISKDIFSSFDVMMMLAGGSAANAALTDQKLAKRLEEVIAIFGTNVDERQAVSEQRFQAAMDRIMDLEARRQVADERVKHIGQKMIDEADRHRKEKIGMERKQNQLRNKIIELEQKLQSDKAEWVALERELETVKGDKEALVQAIALAEAKTKQQRHDLYVHIATLSQQLLVEQRKYTMSFQEEADPLDVDLVMQIANCGVASDISPEILQRMIQVTQRPDDPTKVACQEALVDQCEYLRKDVRAWKSVAIESGVNLQLRTVEKTDLEEDLHRVIGFAKDNNLPVPLDLVKSRVEADGINAFDDNTNFKEVCRTLRTDAKVSAKRLHEIRNRMEGILPMVEKAAKGDLMLYNPADAAKYARGPGGGDDQVRDDLGSLMEEVDWTEKVESTLRERLLDNAKEIRQLKTDKQLVEKARLLERIEWVDQWCSLLKQLPPVIVSGINTDGLAALTDSEAILEECRNVQVQFKEAVAKERNDFVEECAQEKEKLMILAREVQEAKEEMMVERRALAALDPHALALKRKSTVRFQPPVFATSSNSEKKDESSDDEDSDVENDPLLSNSPIRLGGRVSMFRRPVQTVDGESQTDVEMCDNETTTTDIVLYNRQFKTKETETVRVQRAERGVMAHIVGDDEEVQCDLAPKFDREAAKELLSDLGTLFNKDRDDEARRLLEPPPRPGSPSQFPKRFLCPSCGDNISYVASGLRGPGKQIQTDPPLGSNDGIFHVVEALHIERVTPDERKYIVESMRAACNDHSGIVVKAVDDDVNGCSLLSRFPSLEHAMMYSLKLKSLSESFASPAAGDAGVITPLTSARMSVTSARLKAPLHHEWPTMRSSIASNSKFAVHLCGFAFRNETVGDPSLVGFEEMAKKARGGRENGGLEVSIAKRPKRQGCSDVTSAMSTPSDPSLPAPLDTAVVWSILPLTEAEDRKSFSPSAFPAMAKESYAHGLRKLLEADAPVVDAGEMGSEDGKCHRGVQSDAVIIMTDDDFYALKKAATSMGPATGGVPPGSATGSRSGTPHRGSPVNTTRPSSNTGGGTLRVKPSSAARRPSTAGIKQLTSALGVEVRNDMYVEAITTIWRALDPFIPGPSRTAPHRAFSVEEMPLVRLLHEVAAMCNVRGLLGLPECDAEQMMRLHCITTLQYIFSDLQLTDYTLPVKIPLTVAVRSPGTDDLAAALSPVHFTTAISDAFRPILHLLSRAMATTPHNGGKLMVMMRGSSGRSTAEDNGSGKPPQGQAPDKDGAEPTGIKRKDVAAIHDKITELEELVRGTLDELQLSNAQLTASTPPPLLSQVLGWDGVPLSKPPTPLYPEFGDKQLRAGMRDYFPPQVLDDEFSVHDSEDLQNGLAARSPRERYGLSRVLVKPLRTTATIRKVATIDDLAPSVVGPPPPVISANSQPMLNSRRLPSREGGIPVAQRQVKQIHRLQPIRRGEVSQRQASTPQDDHSRPSFSAHGGVVKPHGQHKDATLARTVSSLPNQLPPMSAIIDAFNRSFAGGGATIGTM